MWAKEGFRSISFEGKHEVRSKGAVDVFPHMARGEGLSSSPVDNSLLPDFLLVLIEYSRCRAGRRLLENSENKRAIE